MKLFACHKTFHYAGQCIKNKKGKKEEVATSIDTEVIEFATKFEKELSLVSCLFGTITRSAWFMDNCAWFVDSGASHDMMGSQDLFIDILKGESRMHLEFGIDTKHTVKGVGIVLFQLESRHSLKVEDVLYVLALKMNFLSLSALEDKGVGVLFQDRHVLTYSEGATPETTVSIGVREGNMYRLQSKLVGRYKGI